MTHPWTLLGLSLDEWRALPLAARVPMLASLFLGWQYTRSAPKVPFAPVSFESNAFPSRLVRADDPRTNCSTLTAAVMMGLYPVAGWLREHYEALQVYKGTRRDGPTWAARDVRVALSATSIEVGQWYLVQAWRSSGTGHAFLVLGQPDGQVLRLHAGPNRGAELHSIPWATIVRQYDADVFLAELLELR